jgi:hypothetical protein
LIDTFSSSLLPDTFAVCLDGSVIFFDVGGLVPTEVLDLTIADGLG